MRPRVIPTLLIEKGGLVKTVRFKKRTYIGDPINAVRIYNNLEVDEIIVIDISSTRNRKKPDLGFIREFASESFMPFCYGGGVTSIQEMRNLFNQGVEKVSLNQALLKDVKLLGKAAAEFGSQSVVGCMDVKKDFWGRKWVYDYTQEKCLRHQPQAYASRLAEEGAGEIFLYSVDQDGMMGGYDLDLVREISSSVEIPVIVCGGAGGLDDLVQAVRSGAAAVAAGSMFVYQGRQKGVLINYLSESDLESAFAEARGSRRETEESGI